MIQSFNQLIQFNSILIHALEYCSQVWAASLARLGKNFDWERGFLGLDGADARLEHRGVDRGGDAGQDLRALRQLGLRDLREKGRDKRLKTNILKNRYGIHLDF